MEIRGLFQGVSPLMAPFVNSAKKDIALTECLRRSLDHASSEHGQDPDAIGAIITGLIDSGRRLDLLTANVVRPSARPRWRAALAQILTDPDGPELYEVNLDSFTEAAVERFAEELHIDASKPDSPLTNAVLVALSESPAPRVQPPPLGTTRISNLSTIPAPTGVIGRQEVDDVKEALRTASPIFLSGPPGAGKSTIARSVADQMSEALGDLSVWWVDATSQESVTASCIALCRELGHAPADDAAAQARSLIARGGEWLIVMDNARSLDVVADVVPSNVRTVRALITSRAPLNTHHPHHQPVGPAGDDLMLKIAQTSLTTLPSDDVLSGLIRDCDGNPLALSTVCRYISATGAPVSEVLSLMAARPGAVLQDGPGPHYSAGFAPVIVKALRSLEGSRALDVMAALSLAGGHLQRQDLYRATGSDMEELHVALRRLMELGLISSSDAEVSCHALLSAVALETIEETQLCSVANTVFTVLFSTVWQQDEQRLLELARISEALPDRIARACPESVDARLSCAVQLSGHGLGSSADAQLRRASATITTESSLRDRAQLLVSKAIVQLNRGDLQAAERSARESIELNAKRDPATEEEGIREVAARGLLCLARCREYYEDWAQAADYARLAEKLSGGDTEVHALRVSLEIPLLSEKDQLAAYESIARTLSLAPGTRAAAFSQASRVAGATGAYQRAVDLAREACRIDASHDGEHTQHFARDLSDLGMALIANGEPVEAERPLRQSIDIYENERSDNLFSALPRMHLGRALVAQAGYGDSPASIELKAQARTVLAPAIALQRTLAPGTKEMASLLFARAQATEDHEQVIDLYREALEIDRSLFEDSHVEVCMDVNALAGRLCEAGRWQEARRTLDIAKTGIPELESTRPPVAFEFLLLQMLIYLSTEPSGLETAEMRGVAARVRRLLDSGTQEPIVSQLAIELLKRYHESR